MASKKFGLRVACGVAVLSMSCSPQPKNGGTPTPTPPPDPTPSSERYNDLGFTPHVEGEPFDSYCGLVMTGYQGWFGAPGDGCSHGGEWYHYQEGDSFEPGVLRNSIDFWPDMTEYEVQYPKQPAPESWKFRRTDGTPVTVYSAYDESSVMLHFRWMKEYGIDGAFMQRFVGEVIDNPHGKDHFDRVLASAMKASNTHQRAISVMYDLGGYMDKKNLRRNTAALLADMREIADKYSILTDRGKQKFYLHHNGKPLVTLWGVGFNDNRPYSLDDIEDLMKGLKNMGFSIMLGVPTHWRERRNDALADPKLHELIKAADVIMPWFVGRYGDNNYANFHGLIRQDIKWCKTNKVDYAPLCYPGSCDRNMHPQNDVNPRNGGKFLWNQMSHCIHSGAKMLYIAMFDEIDEGTAIYKCLNQKDVPSNLPDNDYWVVYRQGKGYTVRSLEQEEANPTILDKGDKRVLASTITFMGIEDDLPTDHYLWLTGEGRRMLRGESPLQKSMPTRK